MASKTIQSTKLYSSDLCGKNVEELTLFMSKFRDPSKLDASNVDCSSYSSETVSGNAQVCFADLNGDGTVNSADLAQLLGAWGVNPGHPADFTGDGVVDSADLPILLGAWGVNPGHPADFTGDGVVDSADLPLLLGNWFD